MPPATHSTRHGAKTRHLRPPEPSNSTKRPNGRANSDLMEPPPRHQPNMGMLPAHHPTVKVPGAPDEAIASYGHRKDAPSSAGASSISAGEDGGFAAAARHEGGGGQARAR